MRAPVSAPTPTTMTPATTPAQWLLEAGLGGVPLTQTNALGRAVVRDAAKLWPHWWDAELFGEPYREAELAPLEALREGLRRLKLMRPRNKKLLTTSRGRELLADPGALHRMLATDIVAADPFTVSVADVVIARLVRGAETKLDGLTEAALERVLRKGWRVDGRPPDEQDLSWAVSDVTRRGEAYGFIDWRIERGSDFGLRISLTDLGREVLTEDPQPVDGNVDGSMRGPAA